MSDFFGLGETVMSANAYRSKKKKKMLKYEKQRFVQK